jgi:hypothetical protein
LPNWCFALAISDLCLELLLTDLDNAVRIHFAKGIEIFQELSSYDVYGNLGRHQCWGSLLDLLLHILCISEKLKVQIDLAGRFSIVKYLNPFIIEFIACAKLFQLNSL